MSSGYRHHPQGRPAELLDFVGFESIVQVTAVFRVKICGVRLENDVRSVEASGGDAIGLNFFPSSIRFVDPNLESTIRLSTLGKELGLLRVGVFVNESAPFIAEVVERVGLDAIQLHGDEPTEMVNALSGTQCRVVRAIKLPKTKFDIAYLEECSVQWIRLGCHLLLDVDAGAAHGGSGKTLDWPSVAAWAAENPTVRWTLAGGLKPENVAEAIQTCGASSVDTASGVECPRGVKNEERIRAFVTAAR
jgi:phosphoribosylanthranilate isomerase